MESPISHRTGRIDLHSHLLPGIDDGCWNIAESVACVRSLVQHGFVGTVCTPHIWLDEFPRNTPRNIAIWVDQLAKNLADLEIEYRVWPGGELRLEVNTIAALQSQGVPTLADSRYVLTDYWGRRWPAYADDALDYLVQQGYQPILAHPERMGLAEDELEELLSSLTRRGILLQGNLNSLSGGEGPQAQQRMHAWLAEGRYWLLATDMHGPDTLPGRMAGIDTAEKDFGEATVAQMLGARPREIVTQSE